MFRSAVRLGIPFLRAKSEVASLTRIEATLHRKSFRRRFVRLGLVLLNFSVIAAVVGLVFFNRSQSGIAAPALTAGGDQSAAAPVDQLASVRIALNVARMANLPETGAVVELANSESIQLALASTNSEIVNKPQAVSSAFLSNKDIHTYIAQPGDTVSSVAAKFGVSSDSILWSNGLLGNTLAAGKKLLIPPLNGIVYTVKAGDTPANLASKYRANEDKIIAYNDAEIGGLQVGEQIIIPDGSIVYTPVYYSGYASGFAFGTSAIYGYNGYDYGNCTWYVATQIAVPANWGNAATWAAGARASGWHVSPIPTVGAIAQTPYAAGGLGHVAIVDGVSPDGSQVLIRDMNGIAGFARVGTAWEPTSVYQNFITAP